MGNKEIIPAMTGVRKEAFDRIAASYIGNTSYYQLSLRASNTLKILKKRAESMDGEYSNKPELTKEIAVVEAMLRELNIMMAE